jgi:signal transduction histidine kinase
VLQNLVTNAAFHAYGDAGGKLGITVRKAVAQEGKVELVVIDEGRGMSDEEAARCTDAFYSTTRTKPGAGLGLFIARHVIEAELGGSMLLETRPGAGVRWTLLLPVATGGV